MVQRPDQFRDLSSDRHAPFGLVGKNRLAVQDHVQHTNPGKAHLRREVQFLLDFPLEAPRLQEDADSGETALDLDVHEASLSASRTGAVAWIGGTRTEEPSNLPSVFPAAASARCTSTIFSTPRRPYRCLQASLPSACASPYGSGSREIGGLWRSWTASAMPTSWARFSHEGRAGSPVLDVGRGWMYLLRLREAICSRVSWPELAQTT